MKTLSERNRILNEVKDSCYLAFFDGNPEEGGKEILTGRKKINFPVATNGYMKSTNQIDITGGEEDIVAYGETSQKTYTGKNFINSNIPPVTSSGRTTIAQVDNGIEVVRKNTQQTGAAYAIVPIQNVDRLLGQVVSYSFNVDGDRADEVMTLYGYKNGAVTNTRKMGFNNTSGSFTMPASLPEGEDGYCFCFYVVTGEDKKATFTNIQLELGSTPTEYEPFVGAIPSPNPSYPQSITNIRIGEVDLCKLSGGDVWQDYIFTRDGKWFKHAEIRRIVIVPNSLGSYNAHSDQYITVNYSYSGLKRVGNGSKVPLSNKFISSSMARTWAGNDIFAVSQASNGSYLQFTLDKSIGSSLEDVQDYFSQIGTVEVYAALDTATENQIVGETTISALEEMFGDATGVAKFWGVYDSAVGGKLLYYYIMPYDVNIVQGSTITINAGNCVLKEG